MFHNVKSKLVTVLTALIIASCAAQPVPAAELRSTTPPKTHQERQQGALCSDIVQYNLEVHSMLQEGLKPEDAVAVHFEILRQNGQELPSTVIKLINQMFVLTLNNTSAKRSELGPFLMVQCNLLIETAIKEQQNTQVKPYKFL